MEEQIKAITVAIKQALEDLGGVDFIKSGEFFGRKQGK